MPDLSTLTTVITADATGFTAGVNKAVNDAERFRSSVNSSITGGLGNIQSTIDGLSSKIFSFQGLLRVGFGYQVTRAAFRELHEGVINAASGFLEGIRGGEGFGKAMEDAGLKALGLKTNLQEAAEMGAKLKESIDLLDKAKGLGDTAFRGKELQIYPNLPHGDAALAAYQKAADDAQESVAPFYKERHRIEVENTNGQFAGEGDYQSAIADLEKKYAPLRAQRDKALDDLQKYQERAGAANSVQGFLRDPLGSINTLAGLPNFAEDLRSNALATLRNDVLRPGRDLGSDILSPITGAIHSIMEDAKKLNAEFAEGGKLYESTRNPLERHANAMAQLDDLLDDKAITSDVYARRKQQLDMQLEKDTGFDQKESLKAKSTRGGVESPEEFYKQLQDSVLGGKDPATSKKQDEANVHLQNIDDNLKAAASAEFMFS